MPSSFLFVLFLIVVFEFLFILVDQKQLDCDFILKICHCLLMVLNVYSKNELGQIYFTFRSTYSIVSLLRF